MVFDRPPHHPVHPHGIYLTDTSKGYLAAVRSVNARLSSICAAIRDAKGDPREIVWPDAPPTPLSRGVVKGVGFWFLSRYPRWMWDGYYILEDVSISADGSEHFPKKLTARQHLTLVEARRVIAYYDRKKP